MRFPCCSLPCSSVALLIVRCLAHADRFEALPLLPDAEPGYAIPLPCNSEAILGESPLWPGLTLHRLALPLLAGAMLLPILRFSWLCPCYTVPRFALAHLFCALPLLGYESVTIVTPKNTEVKSK